MFGLRSAQQIIQAKNYVKEVKLSTKTDALETYRQENKDDPISLQLVTADILPASLEVSAKEIKSLPDIKTDLEALTGIDEVVFQQDITEKLANWTNHLRSGGLILITILSLTSIIQIMVSTSMKVSAKSTAIKTMQLLGATGWYIKAPFILEGIVYGFLAAVLGWLATYVSILYLTPWLLNFLGEIPLLPVSPLFMLILLGAGMFAGVLLGALSSLLATHRFLR